MKRMKIAGEPARIHSFPFPFQPTPAGSLATIHSLQDRVFLYTLLVCE
jgi:hypothetical protein